MKALSLLQPWAQAIMNLGKRIENRVSESSAHKALLTYREPFLLHASKGVGTIFEFQDACDAIADIVPSEDWERFEEEWLFTRTHRHQRVLAPSERMPRGCIIGMATCVGLVRPDGEPYLLEGARALQQLKPDMRWHAPGQWGHVLVNVRPLPLVPCSGALGLWDVPPDVMANLPEAVDNA